MKTAHFQKKTIKTSQDLSAAALSFTTTISRQFKLESVHIHASQAISETITVSRVSASGANYSTSIGKRTLVAEQDFVFRPQGECNFMDGDELKIACTDAGGVGIVYAEIRTSEM